jgi:hypothetical protein
LRGQWRLRTAFPALVALVAKLTGAVRAPA